MSAPAAARQTEARVPPPRLLDLFCGAGGCSVGYQRAGFEVVGVDLAPQPHYPFEFHQGDALEYLREHGHEFDAIHASPPCQAYSSLQALHKHIERADLLAPTREALRLSGRLWVIENVIGAPIQSGIYLCGTMFDLRVYRHRWFETPFLIWQPPHPRHTMPAYAHRAPDGRSRKEIYMAGDSFASVTGNAGSYAGPGMGIDWMIGSELSQAIPPAYTEFVGRELMKAVLDEESSHARAI